VVSCSYFIAAEEKRTKSDLEALVDEGEIL
jgi:hypothetical protein